MPDELLGKVLSENLTAKQLSAVSQANREINSFVEDNMRFSLKDIDIESKSALFTYENEQGQKSFLLVVANYLWSVRLRSS